MITNIITINQLVSIFNDFANGHKQLNDFGYGSPYDIGTSDEMNFPYLWMSNGIANSISVKNRNQTPTLNFIFLFSDQVNIQANYNDDNGHESDNSAEILSDMLQVVQDFIQYLVIDLAQYGINIVGEEVIPEPYYRQTKDVVTGWKLDVKLRLLHSNCIYPFN